MQEAKSAKSNGVCRWCGGACKGGQRSWCVARIFPHFSASQPRFGKPSNTCFGKPCRRPVPALVATLLACASTRLSGLCRRVCGSRAEGRAEGRVRG